MFELLLMRHAKSDWHSHLADKERPLNERGRRDAIHMGRYLEREGLTPDRMLVSVAERTQETARLLLQAVPVAEENIIIDNKGNTTYLTAANFTEINKSYNFESITLVSQFFHLSRSKLIFRKFGFKNLSTVHAQYFELRDIYSLIREFPAYYKYLLFY